jgi:hypothetical protein
MRGGRRDIDVVGGLRAQGLRARIARDLHGGEPTAVVSHT